MCVIAIGTDKALIEEIKRLKEAYRDRLICDGHRMDVGDEWKGMVDLTEAHNRTRWIRTDKKAFIHFGVTNYERTVVFEWDARREKLGDLSWWTATNPEPSLM
jgi:hypothetical protein